MKIICPGCQNLQEYNQQKKNNKRPRTKCKKCSKWIEVNKDTIVLNNISPRKKKEKKGNDGAPPPPSLTNPKPPDYSQINIKSLIKNSCIDSVIFKDKGYQKALEILTKPEFIEGGQIKDKIYWTSDIRPYERPKFLFSWQNTAIEFMKAGHCMYLADRQLPGKTTAAAIADFEDMLENPGLTITLVAPTAPLAKVLFFQMFKETIVEKNFVEGKFIETGKRISMWDEIFEPYFISDNVMQKVMKNGSRIRIITLDVKAVQGISADIIHIEEFDKCVLEDQKLQALAALFAQIRARPNARIRITCNNASGVFRVVRDELKKFGFYFPIFMTVPRTRDQLFTGEHYVFNEGYHYDKKPEIDEILTILMDCLMGQEYTEAQLFNIDSYAGEVWNPDKLELAFNKGKKLVPKDRYEHSCMGIDPGAVHDFAVTIYGKEGDQVIELWVKSFTISGKTETETEKMIETIAQDCATAYVKYECEFVASESNSGARLIIPFIGSYVKELIESLKGQSFATWNILWSNFGRDSEEGKPVVKMIPKADFITLMSILIDFEMITLQSRNIAENRMRMQFARYDPAKTAEKYKGDFVDASLHACWWLCGGRKFINNILGAKEQKMVYAL